MASATMTDQQDNRAQFVGNRVGGQGLFLLPDAYLLDSKPFSDSGQFVW